MMMSHDIDAILAHTYQTCLYRFGDCTCVFGAVEALKNEVRRLRTRLDAARADTLELAATEAEKTRMMILTKAEIADGILDDGHPVIRARAQMRREIAAALRAEAASILVGAAEEPRG